MTGSSDWEPKSGTGDVKHSLTTSTAATPRDVDIRFPSATVVSASAGSGKTYALALRIAQFLLSPRVPHAGLQNLVAMTFTNAAAEEMRMRVVRFLKEAALEGEHPSEDVLRLRELVTLPRDELHRRAGDLLDTIFARYDDFQVRTIDSFIARAFKASALEAGLPPDFELVKMQRPLIEAAFDAYVREAARRQSGAQGILDLASLLDASTSAPSFDWNPYSRIVRGSVAILRQIAARPADLDAGDQATTLDATLQLVRETSRELKSALQQSGLKARKVVTEDIDRVLGDTWRKALRAKPDEGPLVKSNPRTAANAAAWERIEQLFDRLNELRSTLAFEDAAAYYRPFVRALAVVADAIDATKRMQGMYAIDDVNRLLWKSVAGGAVPSIYIALGSKLAHYLIDEFQDTSPIQWAALKILVENACAEDGTLYAVGDTKQSIYSFRGADWQIMRRLLDAEETIDLQPCLTASLDTNYRSDEAVVRFVEEVFRRAATQPDYAEAVRMTGLDRCEQYVVEGKSGTGYVEVIRLPKGSETRPEEQTIVGLVRDALARNHSLGSLAILAQTNDQVLEIGGWLNRAGIHFLSYSTLDLRKRPVVVELINLLAWLDSPIDDLAFATFLTGEVFSRFVKSRSGTSGEVEPGRMGRFIADAVRRKRAPLYPAFREEFPDLWEQGFAQLLGRVGYMPAYDVVAELFKTFDVFTLVPDEQTALAGMLDAVHSLEAHGATSLKDLVRFAMAGEGEEEDELWNLSSQKKPDAVTIMTVHKAKGLQFPVLIVLLSDGRWPSDAMKLVEEEGKIRLLHVTKQGAACNPELQAIYDRESMLQCADGLNRLYVALTRARHELYVVTLEKEERGFPSCIIPDAGRPETRPTHPEAGTPAESPEEILPLFHIVRPKEQPVSAERIGFMETRRGDALHRILSRIEFIEEDPAIVLGRLVAQDQDLETSHPGAPSTLLAFLRMPEVSRLFSRREGVRVMNEKEFLSRTGIVQRMDRVMAGDDEVTVVDYKTGGEEYHAAHREQIGRYLEILADVYPGTRCKGIIAYVDRRKTVVVEPSPGGSTR